MPERTIEQLTFREQLRDCAHRTRELAEHIDQNLVRQFHELRKRTRPPKPGDEEVSDVTVRTLGVNAMESHAYAEQFAGQIEAYSRAIDKELTQILKKPVG